jgi:hypothetical protein
MKNVEEEQKLDRHIKRNRKNERNKKGRRKAVL